MIGQIQQCGWGHYQAVGFHRCQSDDTGPWRLYPSKSKLVLENRSQRRCKALEGVDFARRTTRKSLSVKPNVVRTPLISLLPDYGSSTTLILIQLTKFQVLEAIQVKCTYLSGVLLFDRYSSFPFYFSFLELQSGKVNSLLATCLIKLKTKHQMFNLPNRRKRNSGNKGVNKTIAQPCEFHLVVKRCLHDIIVQISVRNSKEHSDQSKILKWFVLRNTWTVDPKKRRHHNHDCRHTFSNLADLCQDRRTYLPPSALV